MNPPIVPLFNANNVCQSKLNIIKYTKLTIIPVRTIYLYSNELFKPIKKYSFAYLYVRKMISPF